MDDISGEYKFVGFKRSTYKHAKFSVSGNCYTEEALDKYKVKFVFGEEEMKLPNVNLLAKSKVLYEGHPICMTLSGDRYSVEDKLEEIDVDYQEVDEPLFPEIPDNVIYSQSYGRKGDAEMSMSLRLRAGRSSPAPMEPRVIAVRLTGDSILVHASTQAPTVARILISEMLGVPMHRVKVDVPNVGGGFGAKQDLSYEELSVIALSYELGENLKWVETRSEHVQNSQARDQEHSIEVGFTKEGKLEFLHDEITYDTGAFPLAWSGISPLFVTLSTMTSAYSFDFSYNVKAIISNKPPQGAYRGFGRPEAVFVMERVMDEISRRTGTDQVEVRRKNLRDLYDVGDVKSVLEEIDKKYKELKGIYGKGVGLAFYVQYAGPNSKLMIEKEKSRIPGYDCVRAFLDLDGWVVIKISATNQGQGMDKAIKNLVSKELGYEKVRVILGDNEVKGYGVWASRTMLTMGNAAVLAARQLKEKVSTLGDWDEVSKMMLTQPWKVMDVSAEACYETEDFVGTASGQISVVKGDCTGIKVVRQFIVADVGVSGDEDIVKGQLMGGAMQGIGGVLYENANDGVEFAVPTSMEAPNFEVKLLHTPSRTPSGVRGVGENGPTGAYASLCNAIRDLGLECNSFPFSIRGERS